MHSQLPTPDTRIEFTHQKFDEIFGTLTAFIETWLKRSAKDLSLLIRLSAKVGGSDIKWNDMAGSLVGMVRAAGQDLGQLFSVNLVHFTGNCGVKALDHLAFHTPHPHLHPELAKIDLSSQYKELLKVIESFAYHRTNCGVLLGSDTCVGTHKGITLGNIEKYGENYHVSEPTWNPNYTWSKSHTIAFFHKNLNQSKYADYWSNAKVLALPKGAQNLDGSW